MVMTLHVPAFGKRLVHETSAFSSISVTHLARSCIKYLGSHGIVHTIHSLHAHNAYVPRYYFSFRAFSLSEALHMSILNSSWYSLRISGSVLLEHNSKPSPRSSSSSRLLHSFILPFNSIVIPFFTTAFLLFSVLPLLFRLLSHHTLKLAP